MINLLIMDVAANIREFKRIIPDEVKLVAISKTKPVELIMKAYHSGHKIFGENKVQDISQKYEEMPKDIEWHMVGHLQTNKVKYIAPFVHLIHAVDSLKLLKVINREAVKNNRVIDCLLQMHIALEDTKFGLDEIELNNFLKSEEYIELKNARIVGLMGMATFTEDESIVRNEFKFLKSILDKLKQGIFKEKEYFKELSMGMSSDFKIAIEEGSTMVRIGSSIFGSRY